MSESTAKKKAKPVKKSDDGKSSVQVRIDREVLVLARNACKESNLSLDEMAESALLGAMGKDDSSSPFTDLNPGTMADAEAFCEKRGWTLSFLVNRAIIDILESMK